MENFIFCAVVSIKNLLIKNILIQKKYEKT